MVKNKYLVLNYFACGFALGIALCGFFFGSIICGMICVLLAGANVPFMMKLYYSMAGKPKIKYVQLETKK